MNRHFITFIVMLTFFVASCNKDNDDKGKSITVSGTITGEHANWKEVSASFDYGFTWAATASISDRKFKLKLPVPDEKYLFDLEDDDDVLGGIVVAKGAYATFFVRKDNQAVMLSLVDVNILTMSMALVNYIYVDANADFVGSFEETDEEMGITLQVDANLKMKKGWNTVIMDIGLSISGNMSMTIKTDEVPPRAIWMALDIPTDLGSRTFLQSSITKYHALLF